MIRPEAGSFKRETVQCDKTNRLAACADAQIPMLFLVLSENSIRTELA